MNENLKALMVQWRRQFPNPLTNQEVLTDLWHQGVRANETYAANCQTQADAEDRAHNVIKHPDDLTGYHVSCIEHWKPGVLRFMGTRWHRGATEAIHGFLTPDILRTAIETHVIKKPDGYVT